MLAPPPRARMERFLRLAAEKRLRDERKRQSQRGGLLHFVRYFWHVLEPQTEMVDGPALEAICRHLEAVTFGEIQKLLINVPPGFMKSLVTDVFWPAWEWGPMNMAHHRFVAFSYAVSLTHRDNGRFRDLIVSREYQEMWSASFKARKIGEEKVTNDRTGWKLASSIGGVGTGERGDRVILDDPHNVKESESDTIRGETVRWFRESMSSRLNDMERSAIVVIMQRVHEEDVSGTIISKGMDYVHLMIPMEYDPGRHCRTAIGWSDWRKKDGELAWPGRFSADVVAKLKRDLGPYASAGQLQQSPTPRGGGILKREYWQLWEEPRFPAFEFILASLDTAFTEKEENDPCAMTIWGYWRENGRPRVMLIWAWRKWLEMHGPEVPRLEGETEKAWEKRASPQWGLCEWVIWSAKKFKADLLLIENKTAGITAGQEIKRTLHRTESFGVKMWDVKGDKVARAHAVEAVWANGLVYAPDRTWADHVIDECAAFPKGKYKDLTDTATQAMQYMRERGLLTFAPEDQAELSALLKHKPKPKPLYPG